MTTSLLFHKYFQLDTVSAFCIDFAGILMLVLLLVTDILNMGKQPGSVSKAAGWYIALLWVLCIMLLWTTKSNITCFAALSASECSAYVAALTPMTTTTHSQTAG